MAHLALAGFEMTVLGYEFPEISPKKSLHDANWLVIDAKIMTDEGRIRLKGDACLLSFELEDFSRQISYFINPQAHRRWQANLDTLESYLKLHVRSDDTGMTFGAEIRVDVGSTIQEFRVQWDIDQRQLEELHRQLVKLSEEFPVKRES